ncbi:MAG: M23 family metallopeptidase [Bacillota bacterium]|nr:M23 family metallopeptidase [Bacillota bacterium]MDI7248675.1 M23 family metallopeptidase [Bacillota bacterium]
MRLRIQPPQVYCEVVSPRSLGEVDAAGRVLGGYQAFGFNLVVEWPGPGEATLAGLDVILRSEGEEVGRRRWPASRLAPWLQAARALRRQADTPGRPPGVVYEGELVWLPGLYFQEPACLAIDELELRVEAWHTPGSGEIVTGRLTVPVRRFHQQSRLRLPFRGAWWVAGGHDWLAAHRLQQSQVFAYDFVRVGPDGKTYSGKGDRVEDYRCYGEPILAPGAGVVVTCQDGIPDQPPGVMPDPGYLAENRWAVAGNHVIIDHGNREYSMLAHLRPGTLRVRTGDRVEAGQVLGECGNTGNSSEPHLHYNLMAGPVMFEAPGLPVRFSGFRLGMGMGPQEGPLLEDEPLPVGHFVIPV